MDPLADLLEGVRARTAAFCEAVLDPPWALRIADEAPLALMTPLRGHAWVVLDDGEPVRLDPGDVAVVRGPEPYAVADEPGTPPSVVVGPDGLHTTGGVDLTADTRLSRHTSALGPRIAGGPEHGTILASGTYQVTGDVSGRLLAALPRALRVPATDLESPILDVLAAEVGRDAPGQQVVLDRLLDLALIATLRAWFARPEADAPGWFRAHGDPLVGSALRAIHADPARAWTVASLAREASASRAAFARRFAALVGEAPITYLTHHRIDRAADLLRDPDVTIEAAARRVGYANAFALSVAFKRVRGITPHQHRRQPGLGWDGNGTVRDPART